MTAAPQWVRERPPTDGEFTELVYDRDAAADVFEHFPDAVFMDASDEIHQGRFAVILPDSKRDDFYVRMIVAGWARDCLGFGLSLRMPEKRDEVRGWIDAAKALKEAS